LKPIEGIEVRLAGIGVSTLTDREGGFKLGFGSFTDSIPGGRHLVVINPGRKASQYGVIEQWAYTQEGRRKELGVLQTPLLDKNEPFRRISSLSGPTPLLGGRVVYDLSQANLTFPDGAPDGDVHTQLLTGPQIGYRTQSISSPFFTFAIQPMGVQVAGPIAVEFALPEEREGRTYINALPERVLLSGLDPQALEIVPAGVGRVDKDARRVRSEGTLALSRLDFLTITPNRSAEAQRLMAEYAAGTLSLQTLVAGLQGSQ
jgi:hypothetical protein